MQHEIGRGLVGQAAYVGTRAIRQTANVNINAAGPGGGNAGRALAKFGRTATINMLTPFGDATYNSLQTQLTRRLSDSSLLGMAYTWSKAMNYADNSDSGLTWNYEPLWERNYALADFDRTHNLQIYGVYALPFGPGRKWATEGLAAAIAGGWQVNGVFSATSGTPFTVTSNAASVNAPGNTQTADQVMDTVEILGGVGRGNSYFDPYAFAPVTDVRFGTAGRNTLRGPGLVNLDASLFRDFTVGGGAIVQFRAEVFNVTNRPAFNNPGANASSADPRRRWHHRQLERLYRDHVGPGDGTAGPVRPQGQVLKGLKTEVDAWVKRWTTRSPNWRRFPRTSETVLAAGCFTNSRTTSSGPGSFETSQDSLSKLAAEARADRTDGRVTDVYSDRL